MWYDDRMLTDEKKLTCHKSDELNNVVMYDVNTYLEEPSWLDSHCFVGNATMTLMTSFMLISSSRFKDDDELFPT